MAADINARRTRLGAELRTLRAATFPSGAALARHLGWVQPKVSRLESGVQIPSDQDLEAWLAATSASESVSAEIYELVEAARLEYTTTRRRATRDSGGLAGHQATLAQLESKAHRIAEYQPAFLPALLQTAGYARELLTLPADSLVTLFGRTEQDVDNLVEQRMNRQHVLYGQGRVVQLIVGEAALYNRPGTTATMRGQLDRLIAVLGVPALEFAILPFSQPLPLIPLCGFGLHDQHVAFIETLSGDQRLSDPDEVTLYVRAFEELRAHSVTGEDAAGLIRRAAEHHRESGGTK